MRRMRLSTVVSLTVLTLAVGLSACASGDDSGEAPASDVGTSAVTTTTSPPSSDDTAPQNSTGRPAATAGDADAATGAEPTVVTEAPPATYLDVYGLQPLVLLTPTEGAGLRPDFAWEPVPGAVDYLLVVVDADGNGYWSWQGGATTIPLGGLPRLADGASGPEISPGMSWSVSGFNAAGQAIALSEIRPISP